MARILIILGIVLILIGVFWPILSNLFGKTGLGRLPGDIAVEGERSKFYFPIVSCLIISAVVSIIVWLVQK
ncbi:MAG: DUF2905 domain-containing protein [Pseudomonadota bacterium]